MALRQIRAEKTIGSSARITAILAVGDDYKRTILDGYKQLIAEQDFASRKATYDSAVASLHEA